MENSTNPTRAFPSIRLVLGFRSGNLPDGNPERLSLIASLDGREISESRVLSKSFDKPQGASVNDLAHDLQCSIANSLATLVEPSAWSCRVASDTTSLFDMRLTASVDSAGLPDLERAAVAALAEVFDGRAELVLSAPGDPQRRRLVLTTGGFMRERPVFGRKGKVRFVLSSPHGQDLELALLQDSGAVNRAIRTGSPVDRATPGGRRSLAISFIESCVREACGDAATNCAIWDYTDTQQPLLFAELPEQALAERLAQELPLRWPDAFARAS